MNQNFNIGPARSLKVYPGDKVDMEVWTYYENNSGFGTSTSSLSTLITNIALAFGGMSGGGGESGAIYDGVAEALGAAGTGSNLGDTRPSAYLNYILYDKAYNFLNMGYTAVPTSALNAQQKISIPTVNIEREGFIFVYLSYENQSNNYVEFDDFKVTHTKSNILQYNEYYPFGLQTPDSWTRENASNRYLYNGGNELNENSGWYETFFRGYDPALGRFMQVDPLAGSFASNSPYHFANNNPLLFNDVMGDSTDFYNSGYRGRIGPGSGNHWSDQYNYMSAKTFIAHYGEMADGGTWSNGRAEYFSSSTEANNYAREHFYWNQYGGEEISRGQWLGLVGVRGNDKYADHYYPGAWEQLQGNPEPLSYIEVLHASSRLDVFRETTFYPSPTSIIIEANTVYIEYDQSGKIKVMNGFRTTQKVIIYENKTTWGTKAFGELRISLSMKEFIYEVENSVYHCLGCHQEQSATDKYWDFIWSKPEDQKGNLNIGAPHR